MSKFLQNDPCEKPLLVILGPTASGKTRLAVQVAARLGGEIISADSRQLYRRMDIGTGKDIVEYDVNGISVPYHLIDIMDAGERYNVSLFQRDFELARELIVGKHQIPVVCGGTGLYIDAVLRGYGLTDVPVDQDLRNELAQRSSVELLEIFDNIKGIHQQSADTSTHKRLIRCIEIASYLNRFPEKEASFPELSGQHDYVCFGLNPAVETRRERITRRLRDRLDQGMIEEVSTLISEGLTPEQFIYYGLEYKYITLYLTGVLKKDEMVGKLETEIHRFAKRQMTFFRKMEKDGIQIRWLDEGMTDHEKCLFVCDQYQSFLKQQAKTASQTSHE